MACGNGGWKKSHNIGGTGGVAVREMQKRAYRIAIQWAKKFQNPAGEW